MLQKTETFDYIDTYNTFPFTENPIWKLINNFWPNEY